MSPIGFLVILALGIGFLMLMILKFKAHPVLAIFLVAAGVGVALGDSLIETMGKINSGFGGTLSGIGLTIILGSILAMGILDTGAATSLSNFFIRLFRGKHLEFAPSLTAFIVSIPVFGDVTMVLTAPIASILSFRKKISMSTMAAFTGLGLFLTHGLVPPTPGILAITLLMGADLGLVVVWGLIISFVAFFGTWLLMHKWCSKEWIPPREDFVKEIEPAKDNASVKDLLIEAKGAPSVLMSALPLLAPVVLLSLGSFGSMVFEEGTAALNILTTLGDRAVALSVGVILAIILGIGRMAKVREAAAKVDSSVNNKTSATSIFLNKWVARGLTVALLPLMVTAMGGALGKVLQTAPAATELGELIAGTGFMPILIPFLISAVMMTAVGSMTMAAMTAAALVLPMLPVLGISPVAAVLAIGAGSMTINHVNNSGFWVMTQFFNLNTKQGLKYVSLPTFVAAIIAIITLAIFNSVGLV